MIVEKAARGSSPRRSLHVGKGPDRLPVLHRPGSVSIGRAASLRPSPFLLWVAADGRPARTVPLRSGSILTVARHPHGGANIVRVNQCRSRTASDSPAITAAHALQYPGRASYPFMPWNAKGHGSTNRKGATSCAPHTATEGNRSAAPINATRACTNGNATGLTRGTRIRFMIGWDGQVYYVVRAQGLFRAGRVRPGIYIPHRST